MGQSANGVLYAAFVGITLILGAIMLFGLGRLLHDWGPVRLVKAVIGEIADGTADFFRRRPGLRAVLRWLVCFVALAVLASIFEAKYPASGTVHTGIRMALMFMSGIIAGIAIRPELAQVKRAEFRFITWLDRTMASLTGTRTEMLRDVIRRQEREIHELENKLNGLDQPSAAVRAGLEIPAGSVPRRDRIGSHAIRPASPVTPTAPAPMAAYEAGPFEDPVGDDADTELVADRFE